MKKIIYLIFLIFLYSSLWVNAVDFSNNYNLILKCSDVWSWCNKKKNIKKVSKSWDYSFRIKDNVWNYSKKIYFKLNDKIIKDVKMPWTNKTRSLILKCKSDNLSGCKKSSNITKNISKNWEYILSKKDKAWNVSGQVFWISKIDTNVPESNFFCNNKSFNVDWNVMCTLIWNNKNILSPEIMNMNGETKWWKLPWFNDYKYKKSNLICLKYKKILFFRICKEYEKPKQTYSFSNNGTYTITWKITDEAGNSSEAVTKTFKIDTSNPSIISNNDFNTWYNKSSLKKINFVIKDQISSTNSDEESWLEKITATLNWKNIQVGWFKKTTWINKVSIYILKNKLLEKLQDSSNNALEISIIDKVGHITNINYNIKYDNINPTLDVDNLDVDNKVYDWHNTNININLTTLDQEWLSWLKYSKFIWDKSGSCSDFWASYDNGMEIILSDEWKHTLYICNEDKPNIIFSMNISNDFNKKTLLNIKNNKNIQSICWMSDDQWRFNTLWKKSIWNFDYIITTDPISKPKYILFWQNVILSEYWIKENDLHKPSKNYKYNISFIWWLNSWRKFIIDELENNWIHVECFWSWWKNWRVSFTKMYEIFNSSKINLNLSNSVHYNFRYLFSWIIHFKKQNKFIDIFRPIANIMLSKKTSEQIKARFFEVMWAGWFLLSYNLDGLDKYFIKNNEIVLYEWWNINDIIKKINYYLSHEEKRQMIAQNWFNKIKSNYTFEKTLTKIINTVIKK